MSKGDYYPAYDGQTRCRTHWFNEKISHGRVSWQHAERMSHWGRWLKRTTGEVPELGAVSESNTGGVAVASQMNLYRCDH